MNWIKTYQQPSEEPDPEREVLVRYPNKTYGLERVDAYKVWPEELTHWCEIEEPDLAKEALKELVAKVIVDMARKDAIEQAKVGK